MITPCEYIDTCPSASGWCQNGEEARKMCMPFVQEAIQQLKDQIALYARESNALCEAARNACKKCPYVSGGWACRHTEHPFCNEVRKLMPQFGTTEEESE